MTSRLFLLQIILFGFVFTIAKTGGELKQQSNPDRIGPSLAEDDVKKQENILISEESSEQRSQPPETEEAMNMMLSFTEVTDEPSTSTNSDVNPFTTQVFITAPKENFPQASSASTLRKDIAEAASTTLSTGFGSTKEKTIATMRLSTTTEKGELLSATTEDSDSNPSTSEVLITATMDITQRDTTVTSRKYVSESTSAMLSEFSSTPAEQTATEEVNATMILPSASTRKDEPLEVTTEAPELTHSTSTDVFTQSSEKSTSQSVITMRREVPETVSAIPSTSTSTQTKQALTDEVTTTTMLSSTAREINQNLNATTEGSNLQRSTSQVVFSSTLKSTQADPIATTRRDVSEISISMQTTASTTEEIKDAASKASTSMEGTLSTATLKEASPSATTKRIFLENDDPAAGTSTVFLSTTATPSPIEASVSTISSTSTVTSPITPTTLLSTESDHSHSTSTPPSSTIIPESTSKKVPSTTTSARPTTAKLQTCVDATRIGNKRINCSMYRKMCRKEGYNNMLKKYCPVTCGYCKLCVDQIRSRRNICTQRIQNTLRMCNHRSVNIRANTRRRCPVTCGICSKGSILLLR